MLCSLLPIHVLIENKFGRNYLLPVPLVVELSRILRLFGRWPIPGFSVCLFVVVLPHSLVSLTWSTPALIHTNEAVSDAGMVYPILLRYMLADPRLQSGPGGQARERGSLYLLPAGGACIRPHRQRNRHLSGARQE